MAVSRRSILWLREGFSRFAPIREHMQAAQQHGIGLIDMVVVNLYDFAKVAARKDAPLEELIENIDIGGPTMIRAAAKNWQDVAVVVSPADYDAILAGVARFQGKSECRHLLEAVA